MEITNKVGIGSEKVENATKYYALVNKIGEDVMRDYSIDAIHNEILKREGDGQTYTIEWRRIADLLEM
jgi:hypothetical protein